MIDNYSRHTATLEVDNISAILDDFTEEAVQPTTYKDKSSVSIVGIITSKKQKVTKNGATMAFITVEDKYAEIEVIVFSKQYAANSSELFVDNAVNIVGNISAEEGEEPKIILSSIKPLLSNSAFLAKPDTVEKPKEARIFVKVDSLSDSRINIIFRLSALHRGRAQVVLYDKSTGKYHAAGVTAEPSDAVLEKLRATFGNDAVVFK